MRIRFLVLVLVICVLPQTMALSAPAPLYSGSLALSSYSALLRCYRLGDSPPVETYFGPWRMLKRGFNSPASMQWPFVWHVDASTPRQHCIVFAGPWQRINDVRRGLYTEVKVPRYSSYKVTVECESNETNTSVSTQYLTQVGGGTFKASFIVPSNQVEWQEFNTQAGDLCRVYGAFSQIPLIWNGPGLPLPQYRGAGGLPLLRPIDAPNTHSRILRWCGGTNPYTVSCNFNILSTRWTRFGIQYMPDFTGTISLSATAGGWSRQLTSVIVRGALITASQSGESDGPPPGKSITISGSTSIFGTGQWAVQADTSPPWPA